MATVHLPAVIRRRVHVPAGWAHLLPAVGLAVFLVWFAAVPGAQRSWLDIGVEATYLASIALGVNLLTGYTGLLSLGHAGFFVAGGYAGAVLAPEMGLSPWMGLPVAFVFGAAMGGLLALLCCHLRGFYLTVVTLAFGSLLPALVMVLREALGGPAGRTVTSPIDVGALPFANGDAYRGLFILSSVWMFVTLGLCRNLVRSKWGRASMAIRESELAASASGVGTYLHKVSAFALSAGIVAVAGVIGAERFLLVSPVSGSQEQSFRYVVVIALGGLGTLAGPIIGAFGITFGFSIAWVQTHLVNQQALIFGLLGLVGVALAPEGAMGSLRKLAASSFLRRLAHKTDANRHKNVVGIAPAAVLRDVPVGDTPALELTSLTKRFGGLVALDDIDFVVAPGTVHGLIGPNGSGKTTLLNLVSGVAPASAGRVTIGGRDGGPASAHRRAALGVARTFQNLHLWRRMTVRDNVLVGCHRSLRSNLAQSALGTPRARQAERDARAHADALLELVGLAGRGDHLAGSLPFAEQRRLEIARALASDPDLLLLDEPAAGLHPNDLHELVALIKRLKQTGVTVLIVEHHMEVVMKVCDRVSVLDFGSKIAEGTPRQIQRNKAVITAYLGDGRGMSLLEVSGLSVRYGAADAVSDLSLRVDAGEVVTIIGSNGAGKTTTLRAVTGMHVPNMRVSGHITFDGREIAGLTSHRIAHLGLIHVPEGRRVFPNSSVEENLILGSYRLKRRQRAVARAAAIEHVYDHFPALLARRSQFAGFLSGGEQQQLAIGRALMAEPKLLVLDEPSLGLAPRLVSEMFTTIRNLAASGTTILLVEQMARQALAVAHRAYALSGGRLVREGIAADLVDDKNIRAAYLGA